MPAKIQGLTEAEVIERRNRGLGNESSNRGGRSYLNIIRANVFSIFNLILFTIGIALLSLGRVSDALTSVGLGIMNSIIGTVQEIRAKRQLDQISLLNRPEVMVVRDGAEQIIDPSELVQGDIVRIAAGDQVVVDGLLLSDTLLEVDESLLTGEADLIRKENGHELLSGSVCITGEGYYEAVKVGEASFANQLTSTAKNFTVSQTPLQRQINLIVRLLMVVVLIMSVIIFVAALLDDLSTTRLVQIAAVLSGQVPYGLFFLIVVAYALGTATMAQKGALVQQSNAIESLSNIDVLCTDKTGTLTANRLQFHDLRTMGDQDRDSVMVMLGDFVRSASATNKTSEAIIEGTLGEKRPLSDEVAFSSARKWSAVAFNTSDRQGSYVLGAVEMLVAHLPDGSDDPHGPLMTQVQSWSDQGLRVLLFAYHPTETQLHSGEVPQLPSLTPLAIVSLSDELRPMVKETIAAFTDLGIKLKVISGDNPSTVASLAKQAGLPDDIKLFAGPQLAEAPDGTFQEMAREGSIFGRITPDQKERLVNSLMEDGQYVAMIGDGVNDVLSLKKSSLGIAMQSGSSATRNVADIVLLNDSFSSLQPAFDEGRRIIGGVTNSLYLFVTRSVASVLLIIAITMIGLPFPFDPAQVALVSYTVGVPSFFFTIWARPMRMDHNLIYRLFRFAIPFAVVTMLMGVMVYLVFYNGISVEINDVRIPRRVLAEYSDYIGVSPDDEAVLESFPLIFAQTALSIFFGLTSMLTVLFLAPAHRFFAVWRPADPYNWRFVWLTVGMTLFFVFFYFTEYSSFVGLLPLPPRMLAILCAAATVWFFIMRAMLRYRVFDRIFDS